MSVSTVCFQALTLLVAMFGPAAASAQMIPSSRVITWQGNVGVPGGIPNRTLSCTTVECNTLYAGTVTATSINAAITSAPANTVVRIPAGTFQITAPITLKSNVTLRGAGRTSTILDIRHTGNSIQTPSLQWVGELGAERAITSGYAQGSTSIAASNVSGVPAGTMIIIYEENESFVWTRAGTLNRMRQPVMVTGVSGNSISFSPPLVYGLSSSLSPQYKVLMGYTELAGVEDMKITAQNSGGQAYSGSFPNTYRCWVKNTEWAYIADYGLLWMYGVRNEVRDSYFHHTTASNEGYAVYVYAMNTGMLIENNAFAEMWAGVMLNDAMGSVVAYNYVKDTYVPPLGAWPHQVPAFNASHSPHGMMTLWEGNVGQQWQNDGYHGSTSHQTLFRNNFHGLNSYYTTNRKMIDLTRYSRYYNVIGNVLGSSTWTAASYEMSGQPGYEQSTVYRLGYPNMGNNAYSASNPPSNADDGGLDPAVRETLLRHMNYDYKSAAVKYCGDTGEPACQGGDASRILPNSLYLSSKPSWWGNLRWPAIGPELSPMVGQIPAEQFLQTTPTTPVPQKPQNLRIIP